jgi:hypothetical protein
MEEFADASKYDVLSKIGNLLKTQYFEKEKLTLKGHGSFGVVKKVRRQSDGKVSKCLSNTTRS